MCQQGLSDPDGTALAGAMRACAALENVEMLAKLIPKLKELKFLLKGDILFACDLIPQIGKDAGIHMQSIFHMKVSAYRCTPVFLLKMFYKIQDR